MVTHIQGPNPTSLTRNPIRIKLKATDALGGLFGGIGVSALLTTPATVFSDLDTLLFKWTEPDGTLHSVTFIALPTPTDENHIQSATGAPGDFFTWLESVADVIGNHHQISPFFTITAIDDDPIYSLKAVAKDLDPDWRCEWDDSGLTNAANVEVSQNNTVTADNTPDNYKVVLDLFFEDVYESGDFVKITQLEGYPDNDGFVYFTINDILHASTKRTLEETPIPDYNNQSPYLADNRRRYWYRFAEAYGAPVTYQAWSNQSVKEVMLGGIDTQSALNNYDFFASFANHNSFLTYQPPAKRVTKTQPEHIAWINHFNEEMEVWLNLFPYKADAEAAFASLTKYSSSPISVPAGHVVIFPIGYTALDLGSQASEVVKYGIQVRASNGTAQDGSDVRYYYVDDNYYQGDKDLMYLNVFGLPETLHCKGYHTKDLEVERQKVDRVIPPTATGEYIKTEQYDQFHQNIFTYRTGYISRREADALQEMLIENKVWEVSSDGAAAIDILANTFQVTETFRLLHALTFDAVRSLPPGAYYNNYNNSEVIYLIGDANSNTVIGNQASNEVLGNE